MFRGYLDFYELTPAQAASAAHANDDVRQHPGIYLYRTAGESLTGIYYGPDITDDTQGPLVNFLTGQYEDRPDEVTARGNNTLPEWSANYPDGHSEGFADLAAESGWGGCAECGEWADTATMLEVDGFYYHIQCQPGLEEAERAEINRILEEWGPVIAVVNDDDYEEDAGDRADLDAAFDLINQNAKQGRFVVVSVTRGLVEAVDSDSLVDEDGDPLAPRVAEAAEWENAVNRFNVWVEAQTEQVSLPLVKIDSKEAWESFWRSLREQEDEPTTIYPYPDPPADHEKDLHHPGDCTCEECNQVIEPTEWLGDDDDPYWTGDLIDPDLADPWG